MGFQHVHGVHKHPKRAPSPAPEAAPELAKRDCQFYQAPKMGDKVDALQPLTVTWNPSCLTSSSSSSPPKTIDIYLYAPTSANPRIHIWSGVSVARGSFPVELMPRWWNATSSQQLQIIITPSDQPLFMSSLPGGPLFTATYTPPATGVPDSANLDKVDSGLTVVGDLQVKKGPTPGGKAAAVILPLLVIALCIGAYIKFKRQKTKDKRKTWTEKVDKRMSTISSDWKSVTAGGANAAIRNSIAVGNRNSSFSFGAIRPSSTFAVESGAGGDPEKPAGVRTGTGVGLRNPAALSTYSNGDRVSRVSFAPDTRSSTRVSFADSRPSGESRRTRAFHSAYIPPVPALPESAATTDSPTSPSFGILQNVEKGRSSTEDATPDARFSPRQTQGPLTLTPEDIRARIAAGSRNGSGKHGYKDSNNEGFDEVMPALSMMRTGGNAAADQDQDDYLFPTPQPAPAPSAPTPPPISPPPAAYMSMQPMPASVMSPDEMLRAYAERKRTMSLTAGKAVPISGPMPAGAIPTVPNVGASGMRVLYDANQGVAPAGITPQNHGQTDSYGASGVDATSQYTLSTYTTGSEPIVQHVQSVYGIQSVYAVQGQGQVGYAFGHHPNGSIGVPVGAFGGAAYAIGDDDESVRGVEGQQQQQQGMQYQQYQPQAHGLGLEPEPEADAGVGMAGRGAFGYGAGANGGYGGYAS